MAGPHWQSLALLPGIGRSIGEGWQRNQLQSALSGLGPNASMGELAAALHEIDPELSLKARIAGMREQSTPQWKVHPGTGQFYDQNSPTTPALGGSVVGGKPQNAPSGYTWVDPQDASKGLKAIAGGPAEKVTPEVSARVGLADNFLKQYPDIIAGIEAGIATGPVDYAIGAFGRGEAGQIHRRLDSGAEALLRMLTGAGMNKDEASEYVRRYRASWRDDAPTLKNKAEQLKVELEAMKESLLKGRNPNIGQGGVGTDVTTEQPEQWQIDILISDPSPEAIAEFEELFGEGSSSQYLGQ